MLSKFDIILLRITILISQYKKFKSINSILQNNQIFKLLIFIAPQKQQLKRIIHLINDSTIWRKLRIKMVQRAFNQSPQTKTRSNKAKVKKYSKVFNSAPFCKFEKTISRNGQKERN